MQAMRKTRDGGPRPGREDDATRQTTLRLTEDILDRADALIGRLTIQRGYTCARADVLREALVRGLKELEAER